MDLQKQKSLKTKLKNLKQWLELGYHADMKYMSQNFEKRKDIKNILSSAESVISLGLNYYTDESHSHITSKGKISRYAWGKDYHLIIWEKLDKLIEELKKIRSDFEAASYVDTGPVMDKVWAVKSWHWLAGQTYKCN